MLLKSIPILCKKKHEKQQQNVGLYMFSKIELIDFIFNFSICIQIFIILFCAANIKYINIIYSHVAWTEANSHLTTNKRAHFFQIYIEIDLKIDRRMRLCYNKKAQSLLWLLACMQWMDLKMLNTGLKKFEYHEKVNILCHSFQKVKSMYYIDSLHIEWNISSFYFLTFLDMIMAYR